MRVTVKRKKISVNTASLSSSMTDGILELTKIENKVQDLIKSERLLKESKTLGPLLGIVQDLRKHRSSDISDVKATSRYLAAIQKRIARLT